MIEWEIHALEFGNCNCDYGCGCQFNALPTHGDCRAIAFFRIDEGHFGKTRLDGLNMALAVKWPGPVHEGRGHMQPIVAAEADADQRQALLSIMTGKETDEMATFFAVYRGHVREDPRSGVFAHQHRCGYGGPVGDMQGRRRRIRAWTADSQPGDGQGASGRHRAAERVRVHPERGRTRMVGVDRRGGDDGSRTVMPSGASFI